MTTWITVDVDFPWRDKVKKFAKAMGISDQAAAGAILRLWCWTATNHPDGDLGDITEDEIREIMGFNRKYLGKFRGNFVEILPKLRSNSVKLMDGNFIHNWEYRSGHFLEKLKRKRQKSRESTRRWRAKRKERDYALKLLCDDNVTVTSKTECDRRDESVNPLREEKRRKRYKEDTIDSTPPPSPSVNSIDAMKKKLKGKEVTVRKDFQSQVFRLYTDISGVRIDDTNRGKSCQAVAAIQKAGYTIKDVMEAIYFVQEQFPEHWDLMTVKKYIGRVKGRRVKPVPYTPYG